MYAHAPENMLYYSFSAEKQKKKLNHQPGNVDMHTQRVLKVYSLV